MEAALVVHALTLVVLHSLCSIANVVCGTSCLCNAFAITRNPHNGDIALCVISITAMLMLTDNN